MLEVHLVPDTAGGGHRTVAGWERELTGHWGERGRGFVSMDEHVVLRAAVRHVVQAERKIEKLNIDLLTFHYYKYKEYFQ